VHKANRCYDRLAAIGLAFLKIGSGQVGGRRPAFLVEMIISDLQRQVEGELAHAEPEVEVLLAEVVSGHTLRVYIDHPQGVTIGLCERVSRLLSHHRNRYALEVSSPGTRRPLTKPDHFRRFLGHKARVRVTKPLDRPAARREGGRRRPERPHRRALTGELLDANDREITLAVGEGVISIPYAEISRSNLVES